MDLSDGMKHLAQTLRELPQDLHIDVTVTAKVNDDVPDGFVEIDSKSQDSTPYEMVVTAQNGIAAKTIILYIHD